MKSKLIPVLIANLFAASGAMAAEGDFQLSGSVGLGLRSINKTGADLSKLNEFRDLGNNGVISEIDVKGRGNTYYLNAFGENLGLDDQYIDLKGGHYGVFKYQVYDNNLRHNLTFGARTPLSPVGGSALTGLPNTNTATWNTFDYSIKRSDTGANFEFSNNSPWYVRADMNDVTRKGVRPMGAAMGTSPGNPLLELPTTVDYRTRNYSIEGGYSSKKGHFAVSWMQSKFSEGVNQMTWPNPFFGNGTDTSLLPPDNELTKIGANGVLKQLPMGSTLAARFTYSKVTNNFAVQTASLNGTGGGITTAAATPATFNGENKHKSASLSLTSNPTKGLDTRLYWNWYQKDNSSTPISYAAGVFSGAGTQAQAIAAAPADALFNYKKNNLGIDLGYRLNSQNKLSGGYDWTDTKRERTDFNRTKDDKVYAEWKNSALDNLEARVKYQYLQRRSDFQYANFDPNGAGAGGMNYYSRAFDYANVNQDLLKLMLDSSPAPFLDLGFEGIFKTNNYKDIGLGRTKDNREEYYLTAAYGDPNVFRVSAFADMETVYNDANHRQAPPPEGLLTDPATATRYNWTSRTKDRNYAIGLGADWPVSGKLTFKGSYIWSKTEGSADFTWQQANQFTAASTPLPIRNYDNTTRHMLNLRGVYKVDKNWEVTGGYAFERYRYNDDGMVNYAYTIGTGTNTNYLTGAYANPDYTANILYMMAKYTF